MFYIDVYDTNFEKVGVIDVFKSCIWSERYNEAGQFEIYIEPSSSIFKLIKKDYYLDLMKDDNIDQHIKSLMIVEDYKLTTDEEKGSSVSIIGRNLNSILDRRVIWEPTLYAGSIQDGIKLLIDKNIINPKNDLRKIENFEFIESEDPNLLRLGFEINTVGDSLYDFINNVCKTYNLGYKILYDFDNKKFLFSLYMGTNRGEDNPDDNLVIEFSPRNDNLLSSNYTKNTSSYKNTILIGGEGEDDKRYFSLLNNYNKGLHRKETFLSSSLKFGDKEERLSIAEYENQLKEEGKEVLKTVENVYAFDGKTLGYTPYDIFKINRDFFLGDIVFIENEYGLKGNSMITELVESYDDNGYALIPTFQSIIKEPTSIQGTVHITDENKQLTLLSLTKPCTIIWGDGNVEKNITGNITHTYDGQEGKYEGLYDFYIYLSDNHDIDICPKFTNSNTLYKITVPNGVQELQEKTFYNCTLIHEINLPNSLKILNGTQMFYNCNNLFSIAVPNSITNANENTFQNCNFLVSANFPYNAEIAPSNYFNNCPKLQSMNFPGNSFSNVGVKTIQENVLNNCPKCTEVLFGSLIENINARFLNGANDTVNLKVSKYPDESTPVPTLTGAFPFNLGEIEVPNSKNFDDSVLNAYKTAWPSYANKIREVDGELPVVDTNNEGYSYADDSVSYDDDDRSEIIYDSDDELGD